MVSIFYYMRVVVLMYMHEATDGAGVSFGPSKLAWLGVAFCVALTLKFGMLPAALIHTAKKAALF